MSTGLLNETEQVTLLLAAENSRKRFPLNGEMIIGRDPACAIVVQSLHISRYHAKIITSEHGTTIEDLGSANGTFINGLRLEGKASLHLGDLLCFDDHAFRILAQQTSATQPESDDSVQKAKAPIWTPPVDVENFSEPVIPQGELVAFSSPQSTDEDEGLSTIRRPNTPTIDESALFDDSQDDTPATTDTTRALTYHEMKELLRQSQNNPDAMVDEEPRFIVETPPLQGKVIPLLPLDMDARWKIGRDLTSKICLRDKSIEIDHAYISRNPSGFRLTATSTAKTYNLNGQSLRDSYLHHGDTVQLGRISLKFQTDVVTTANPLGEFPSEDSTPNKGIQAKELNKMKWNMIATAGFLLVVIVAVVVFAPKG